MGKRKTLDTPEVIQRCLNCPKDKCDNCIAKGHDSPMARYRESHKMQLSESRKKYDAEYARKYYQAHKEEAKERVRRNRLKKRLERLAG